jgi:hypothetical protein
MTNIPGGMPMVGGRGTGNGGMPMVGGGGAGNTMTNGLNPANNIPGDIMTNIPGGMPMVGGRGTGNIMTNIPGGMPMVGGRGTGNITTNIPGGMPMVGGRGTGNIMTNIPGGMPMVGGRGTGNGGMPMAGGGGAGNTMTGGLNPANNIPGGMPMVGGGGIGNSSGNTMTVGLNPGNTMTVGLNPGNNIPGGMPVIGGGGAGNNMTNGNIMTGGLNLNLNPPPLNGVLKTFDDLLTLVGCNPTCIAIIKKINITSLAHVLTWNEEEIDKMIKTFRKYGVEILPNVEKNFLLMVGEAQIRYQTHRRLENMYSATINDFVRWQYRQSEKKEFKDPPATDAPDARALAKCWIKGFEQLDSWIGLHIDSETRMPLAFAIRTYEPHTSVFRERDYKSLEHQYACRTKTHDSTGRPYAWAGKVQRKKLEHPVQNIQGTSGLRIFASVQESTRSWGLFQAEGSLPRPEQRQQCSS